MSWDLQRLGMLAAVVAAAPFIYNQPVAAQGCVPAPPDLVSWWPGDGNANDIVGTNHGTLNGATFAAGKVGQAFSFDGSNDFVDAAQQQVFSGSYTVDAWVNTNTLNPGGFFNEAFILDRTEGGATALINLFQKGSDLVFRIRGDNTLGLSLVKAPGVLITNTWIHVTGVRDISSGQIRIYVNGVLKGTAADGTSGTSTFTFRIGAQPDEQLPWNGLIDEVEVFDRALSASEIQSIFNAGSAGKCKDIDTDGDGIDDDDDSCPDSDLGETIIIDGVDAGVDNELLEDGCTIADLIDVLLADDPSTADVVHFLVALKKDGIISGKDMGAILKALNTP